MVIPGRENYSAPQLTAEMKASTPAIEGTRYLESLTYLTMAQVAELLQVTEEHVRRQNRAGKLPGVETILGVVRVRTDALLGRE
jgi:hypothetical protein